MTFWQLMPADVEAIVTQLKAGRSKQEVAADLGISVEMVSCAERKWQMATNRQAPWYAF
ncbi:uncharacterized protein (DUF433 family) [Symbiobacterium terraclitae]|uniref:Uncharacterized protein (DUF433 family) n=1 Tax=Symbiobacterium terraclitae TaxID=557451 RepID=A0ABS4JNJ8_9FIRM|nr:hypothetical protein [Symbiobacterium terraclitae]MBP2017107.1 uncharacterized protein (DUF433 family) [Symbiobacterium terraclitae]